ncbi:hypothetical protein NST89_14565 [Caldifermentibacillus hisashii]|uniref:hypothetical protein n=1 Tax=Caldifermentibacillus hisashii TaxID=996558 RepID=UPI0031362BE4
MTEKKIDTNKQLHEYELQKNNFVIKVHANSPSTNALRRFQSSLLDILHSSATKEIVNH